MCSSDLSLAETLGRMEAPGVWRAWRSTTTRDWDALAALDAELDALRPSSCARQASRAMGGRLLRTWQLIRPHPTLAFLAEANCLPARTLPVAFGVVSAVAGIEARAAIDGFIYSRLSASVSAAMRLLPIGQHEAHTLLARVLAVAPAVVDALMASDEAPASFAPALDVAAMSHPYVHSTLFLS